MFTGGVSRIQLRKKFNRFADPTQAQPNWKELWSSWAQLDVDASAVPSHWRRAVTGQACSCGGHLGTEVAEDPCWLYSLKMSSKPLLEVELSGTPLCFPQRKEGREGENGSYRFCIF